MQNLVEESIRAIDSTIAYHRNKIKELEKTKKEIMDKYEVKYDD